MAALFLTTFTLLLDTHAFLSYRPLNVLAAYLGALILRLCPLSTALASSQHPSPLTYCLLIITPQLSTLPFTLLWSLTLLPLPSGPHRLYPPFLPVLAVRPSPLPYHLPLLSRLTLIYGLSSLGARVFTHRTHLALAPTLPRIHRLCTPPGLRPPPSPTPYSLVHHAIATPDFTTSVSPQSSAHPIWTALAPSWGPPTPSAFSLASSACLPSSSVCPFHQLASAITSLVSLLTHPDFCHGFPSSLSSFVP